MNDYGDTATVLHAPLVGGYGGQQVRDWANATRTDIACAVQPMRSTEESTGREVITTDKSLHCAGSVPLLAVDRVIYAGSTYDVTGVEVHMMQGVVDHLEATLVLYEEPAV